MGGREVTALWWVLGIFAGSVLVARWQFSRTRAFLQFVWYRHWRMRERQRGWETELYRRYPRFMHWRFRLLLPYYRLRNSDWVWTIRLRLDRWWFRYAMCFAPTCKACGATMFQGSICFECMAQEMVRKERIKMLVGRGDEKATRTAEFFARLVGKPPSKS